LVVGVPHAFAGVWSPDLPEAFCTVFGVSVHACVILYYRYKFVTTHICEFHQIYNFGELVLDKDELIIFEVKRAKYKVVARPNMVKQGTLGILKVMVQRSQPFWRR